MDPIPQCTSEEPSSGISGVDNCQDGSSDTDQEGELSEEGGSDTDQEGEASDEGGSGSEEIGMAVPEEKGGQLAKQELPKEAVVVTPKEQDSSTAEENSSAVDWDDGSASAVEAGEKKSQPSIYIPVERSPDIQVCDGPIVACVRMCVCTRAHAYVCV